MESRTSTAFGIATQVSRSCLAGICKSNEEKQREKVLRSVINIREGEEMTMGWDFAFYRIFHRAAGIAVDTIEQQQDALPALASYACSLAGEERLTGAVRKAHSLYIYGQNPLFLSVSEVNVGVSPTIPIDSVPELIGLSQSSGYLLSAVDEEGEVGMEHAAAPINAVAANEVELAAMINPRSKAGGGIG